MKDNVGLRPYIVSKDFEIIKTWKSDERTHAIKYAFEITKASAVHLNVFPENERAKNVMNQLVLLKEALIKMHFLLKMNPEADTI